MNAAQILIIVGAVLGLVALIPLFRHRHGAQQRLRGQLDGWRSDGRYWGVRIAAQSGSGCEAMRRVESHVFPISSAPPLPLPDCRTRRCRCFYRPFPERRQRERRESDERRSEIRFDLIADDRRLGNDRRRGTDPWRGQPL